DLPVRRSWPWPGSLPRSPVGPHDSLAGMRIDLHTHSTVSDGTLPPAGVIDAAARAGLDVVALTDHDNLAGWPEAQQAATEHGIGFVPGVELSCRWFGDTPPISLHLLGYWVDPDNEPLQA